MKGSVTCMVVVLLTLLPTHGIQFTPLESNKTYYEVTMSSPAKKSYRGAIVMTMAGQGLPQCKQLTYITLINYI